MSKLVPPKSLALTAGLVLLAGLSAKAATQGFFLHPVVAAEPEPTPLLPNAPALAHWNKVYEVFSHPRCANCHVPADNRPRWSGPSYGESWRMHGMNVVAQSAKPTENRDGGKVLPCDTCHMAQNSPLPHGPPGSKVWALAPLTMVWWQKSSKEICEQIKDPARNGNRTLEQVAEHIDHDALVHWGWDPGPGRSPAPYSAKATAESLRAWAKAGAPCPP